MKLALVLLSVVALSTAAPQNYTTHFQIFHESTTDPMPSSTKTTIAADGAVTGTNSTNGAAGTASVGETLSAENKTSETGGAHKVPSGSTSSTAEVTTVRGSLASATAGATFITKTNTDVTVATTYETTDATEATFSGGSTSTTAGITRITVGDTRAKTRVSKANDEPEETSIGVTAGGDVTSRTVESTTKVFFGTTTEEVHDVSSTKAFVNKEKGVRTTKMPATDHKRSENKDNSNKVEIGTVEEPGFAFTFKLPSFFTRYLQTVPTIGLNTSNTTSSSTSNNVHSNIGSVVSSKAQGFNGGLISDSTTTTKTPVSAVSGNGFRPSGAQNNTIPSSSIDAASSNSSFSGHNSLNNQQARLRREHSAQVKKSLTESVREKRSHEAIGYSGLPLNPDYYLPSLTAVGRDNSDAYDYDYYSQLFQPVGTPEEYDEDYSHSGNNGGYSGHFQYIIRTSNIPGELTSFQTSSSVSALHPNSPDTYSSQGASSTGSQTDFSSQTKYPFSLFPAFQSSSNFNFTTNHRPSFGFLDFLGGSSITNADTAFGTQEPVETYNSTTTKTSISSHSSVQHNITDSFSGIQGQDETYHSTTTKASITPVGNDQTSSAKILNSSNNATIPSIATNSSQLNSSKVTTEMIDGPELATTTAEEMIDGTEMIDGAELVTTTAEGIDKKETSNPKFGTNKHVKKSKATLQVQ